MRAISHQTSDIRRQLTAISAFTLIEMLTVIAVVGILAGMLLPALNSARERGRRVACASNLRQIGLAIMGFAADNDNHTPTADSNLITGSTRPVGWAQALVAGGYAVPKVFLCPNDRRTPSGGRNPCSYGIVVGHGNTDNPSANKWIAGSRLTCPYLTNTAVAIVGEFVSGSVQPTIEQTTYAYMTSPSDDAAHQPHSKHAGSNTLAGNYLFLDGHVEWIEKLTTLATDPLASQMFPPPPDPVNPSCP